FSRLVGGWLTLPLIPLGQTILYWLFCLTTFSHSFIFVGWFFVFFFYCFFCCQLPSLRLNITLCCCLFTSNNNYQTVYPLFFISSPIRHISPTSTLLWFLEGTYICFCGD